MSNSILSQNITIKKFLNTLFADCDNYYTPLVAIDNKKKRIAGIEWARWQDEIDIMDFVRENRMYDLYFSCGLREEQQQDGKRGNADDVTIINFLWLDLDTSDGRHAADNLPTRQDVYEWLTRYYLPPSVVVNSGGGYHAYWLLDEPIFIDANNRAHIKELSSRFHELLFKIAHSKGLHADQKHSLDTILRLPNTYNLKKDTPAEVKVMAFYPDRNYSLKQVIDKLSEGETEFPYIEPEHRVYSHILHDGEKHKSDARSVLKKCAFMQSLLSEAESLDYMKWFCGVGILANCENGVEIAHKFSSLDSSRYNWTETHKKIEETLGNGNKGAWTCTRIQKTFGDTHCNLCKFNRKVKSPIVLGNSRSF